MWALCVRTVTELGDYADFDSKDYIESYHLPLSL